MREAVLPAKARLKCIQPGRYLNNIIVQKTNAPDSHDALFCILVLCRYLSINSKAESDFDFCNKLNFVPMIMVQLSEFFAR